MELGGDECYDLNFMTLKIHSFKIRKKIREFAVVWNSLPVDISLDAYMQLKTFLLCFISNLRSHKFVLMAV